MSHPLAYLSYIPMKKKTKTKTVAPAPAVDEKLTISIDLDALDEMLSTIIGTLMAVQTTLQLIAPISEDNEEVEP